MFKLTMEEFLERNRISDADWNRSGCVWEVLVAIAEDHLENHETLVTTAEMFARMIQRIDDVHSVRFRVKDVEHLLEKIVRKCSADDVQEKYKSISVDTYSTVITDLVGIRALHLFKADCFGIDTGIRREWKLCEEPVAYVREGDSDEFREALREHGLTVQEHKAGYRSVHYVASTRPGKRDVFVEVQVRTIFEEGWSEIDHSIRYPNFSDDPVLEHFLTIFNRMAGAADEMGSFVKLLSAYSAESAAQQNVYAKERDDAIAKMEEAIDEATRSAQRSAEQDEMLAKLAAEVKRLKNAADAKDADHTNAMSHTNRAAHLVLSERTGQLSVGGALAEATRFTDQFRATGALQLGSALRESEVMRLSRRVSESGIMRSMHHLEDTPAMRFSRQLGGSPATPFDEDVPSPSKDSDKEKS
ncbi:RelA/SpoT domain-containing protein [Cupriavidus basilensis]|uniref:RelA/SpoT domain-containing protein n=1 Tax=Cupriavidus basilensis TaxID=68895 RepID=UPI0007508EE4|nr:hypothetical protein [Cupriavidus basilensis]